MKENKKAIPPYFGAAYYPEDWPEEEMEKDIAKMLEAGFHVVRIGEFAWKKMEPQEGQFEFLWLHNLINRLGQSGIAVILGTPTATPPVWLLRKFPDAVMEAENGRKRRHGGRRHCCSNNPDYQRYCARITEKLAQEFGEDPNVIGWQIDNEIYTGDLGCFCSNCRSKFLNYLKEKYGGIETINEEWNLNLFSQAYDDFDDIPEPRDAWHNPHLLLEWRTFQNDSHIHFVHMQADILHRFTKAPVGTDIMPFYSMNYGKLAKKLDVIQFNHYHTPENLSDVILWFDFLRTLKEQPFWNTETQTCWNGSVEIGQDIKPDGFCRLNSWLPVALGGEANLYWLWRTHWAGHELMHGSVVDTSGRPMYTFGEVQQTGKEFEKVRDFLNHTRVATEIALHFTSRNWNLFETQHLFSGLNYMEQVANSFHKPVNDCGLRPDVIDASADISGYRVIFSPLMMTLEEENLQERMKEWVENGGIWIAGPLTDIRTGVGTKYRDRHFGFLEELTGAKWLYEAPNRGGAIEGQWKDGAHFSCQICVDLFENEDALVSTIEGPKELLNRAILLKKRVGKGIVYLLGSIPDPESMRKLVLDVCREGGIVPLPTEGALVVVPREGLGESGLILAEYAGKNASSILPSEYLDLLSGGIVSGKLELKPYEVKVLKK